MGRNFRRFHVIAHKRRLSSHWLLCDDIRGVFRHAIPSILDISSVQYKKKRNIKNSAGNRSCRFPMTQASVDVHHCRASLSAIFFLPHLFYFLLPLSCAHFRNFLFSWRWLDFFYLAYVSLFCLFAIFLRRLKVIFTRKWDKSKMKILKYTNISNLLRPRYIISVKLNKLKL